MDPAVSSSAKPARPVREPRSTLYVLGSATMAALVLGFTIFLLVRGFQWRGALAELRAEPGIEILSVERVGFFKKRLLGLRDPLAPTAESILLKHDIGAHNAEVTLTEYHSLNTPYAKQREEVETAKFDGLRDTVLKAVGEFADAATKKREEDLEKITQMLFEARFPEAMKTVDLEWKEGDWYAKGELYAPEREVFVKEAPAYVVEGGLDFDQLVDLTASRTSTLRQQIESPDLFAVDLDDQPVHLDRMVRLVKDYDEVCERSGLNEPRLQLELVATDPAPAMERLTAIKKSLSGPDRLPEERFLADLAKPGNAGTPARASLKLVLLPTP
jgi:hypothetical protein